MMEPTKAEAKGLWVSSHCGREMCAAIMSFWGGGGVPKAICPSFNAQRHYKAPLCDDGIKHTVAMGADRLQLYHRIVSCV